VDFTDITNPLLKVAKLLALKHNASVILLHAVSPVIYLPYPESFGVSPIDLSKLAELEAKSIESAKKRLEALRDFLAGTVRGYSSGCRRAVGGDLGKGGDGRPYNLGKPQQGLGGEDFDRFYLREGGKVLPQAPFGPKG
jgi:hypothetical protein